MNIGAWTALSTWHLLSRKGIALVWAVTVPAAELLRRGECKWESMTGSLGISCKFHPESALRVLFRCSSSKDLKLPITSLPVAACHLPRLPSPPLHLKFLVNEEAEHLAGLFILSPLQKTSYLQAQYKVLLLQTCWVKVFRNICDQFTNIRPKVNDAVAVPYPE